ncbi:MAG TPA: hypothetical protein PKC96_07390 [Bacilli bacterium]|nr:hypothetical protein [Bacilli bacterium]
MTMAWINTISTGLIEWLSSAQALPAMIAVRCLTFDASGHIHLNSLDLDLLMSVISARTDTRWLLSVSNTDEAAFVAVRDNTNGAKDTLLSDVRSLRSLYPLFKGLDIRITSASDSTHRLAVCDLFTDLFLQYKHAYAAGHFNLSLPAILEIECSWVDHAAFAGYFNTVSLLFHADGKMEQIEAVLREATAWYSPGTVLLGLLGAGRMYTATGASDVPFSTAAGFLLGTVSCADGQPCAAFAGHLDTAEYRTVLLPHVYDYASGSATLRLHALVDRDGNDLTPTAFHLLIIMRRYPPTPVAYWYDSFSDYSTLGNYNADDGEYGTENDPDGESSLHYLAGKGELLYSGASFSNFYARLVFLEPADRTSNFGKTGIRCGTLYVVYNDPYKRIEIYQGPYLNAQYLLTTFDVPLERTDDPYTAPHLFILELRKRGTTVTVYYGGRPVITQTVSATSGNVGIVSDYTVLVSEFVIGDAYRYDAHECIRMDLSGQSYLLGRVNRTGAAWNGSVFTLSSLSEEPDSRSVVLEGQLECLSQGTVEGIVCGSNAPLTVTPVDTGAELVMACLGDSRGCAYLVFRTSLDLQELYNHVVYGLGIGGLALDGLGSEDPSFWNLV